MKCSKCGAKDETGKCCSKCGEELYKDLKKKLSDIDIEFEEDKSNRSVDVSNIYNNSTSDESGTVSYNRFGNIKVWFSENFKKMILVIVAVVIVFAGYNIYQRISKPTPKTVVEKCLTKLMNGEVREAFKYTEMGVAIESGLGGEIQDKYFDLLESAIKSNNKIDFLVNVKDMKEISRTDNKITYEITTTMELKGKETSEKKEKIVMIEEDGEYLISITDTISEASGIDLDRLLDE